MQKIASISKDDLNVSLKAMVLKVGDIETSYGRSRFRAVIGDETKAISVTVYDIKKKSIFVVDKGVVLINAIPKESYLAVTSRTEVAMSQGIRVPQAIRDSAPSLTDTEVFKHMTINEAICSPVKTAAAVKGKVMKVSPASTRSYQGKDVPFQEVKVKDHSDKCTVAIWGSLVDTVQEGQLVKFSKCRVRLIGEEKRLSTTPDAQCEVLSNDADLLEVSDDDDDRQSDDGVKTGFSGFISAVFEVDPYLCCIQLSCNNKKLYTIDNKGTLVMKCPTCKMEYRGSNANWYIRASVLFEDQKNESKKLSVFKPELIKILAAKNLPQDISMDREEMMTRLVGAIPIEVKCNIEKNAIRDLVCKRCHDL